MSNSNIRVLVTGASGFVATHVVAQALEAGYIVRGTVRSEEKGKAIKARYARLGDQFEYAVVEDLITGDFTAALKDVSAIIHVASPFFGVVNDPKKDMLDPAIEGTLNVLRSAEKAGIKKVLITSSFVAVFDVAKGGAWRDYTYTDSDWNPATYEAAIKGDMPGIWIYSASKVLAEKAAFDYAKEHPQAGLQITTFNPPFVFGPTEQSVASTASLNTSSDQIYQLLKGNLVPDGLPLFVDVRDVAKAHILALKNDAVVGKRVLLNGGPFTFYEVVQIIAAKRPHLASRLPSLEGVQLNTKPISGVDVSIAKEELGITFIGLEQCILDTVDALVAKEGTEWAKGSL